MTILEKIEQFAPELEQRTESVQLLIEAQSEIERLEKQNTLLKSALMRISDLDAGTEIPRDISEASRIAQEALS